jgi:replicative DNA helicase
LLAFVKKLVLSRDTWKRCRPHIKDDVLSKDQRFLLTQIDAYWNSHPAKAEATLPDFEAYFFGTRASHLKTAEISTYRSLFGMMEKAEDTESEAILEHYIKQDYLGQIQQKVFLASTDPDFELDAIGALVSSYNRELGRAVHTTDVFVTAATASPATRPPGFRFPLKELDLSCGEVAQGDLVILGARPEMGKTTFVAHTAGYMAQQKIHPTRPIIWVNNEERSDKVYRRVVQSVLGCSTADLITDWDRKVEEYRKLVADERLLILKQNECNSTHQLDLLFAEYNPCVIIIDQLDKVSIRGDYSRDDLRLCALYGWARSVAAAYAPVLAVSQLDAEAEGQAFPGFDRLRGSKTDKQGEADLIILIGSEDRTKTSRCIHTPKNKLDGADEMHRHARWEVNFDPIHGRYVSLIK